MVATNDKSDPTTAPAARPDRPAAVWAHALNGPNLITLSRLVLALVLFTLIYVEGFWITAAVVFVIAAATDALDGYIARRYGMVTTLGRILDPFVDKIIVCGTFIFLLERKLDSGINSWMVLIVVSREMFVTSLRAFLEQQGKDFSAALSGKLKMVFQCIALTFSLLSLSPLMASLQVPLGADRFLSFKLIRDVLLWTAVGLTAYSGFAYCVRAFRMMQTDKAA